MDIKTYSIYGLLLIGTGVGLVLSIKNGGSFDTPSGGIKEDTIVEVSLDKPEGVLVRPMISEAVAQDLFNELTKPVFITTPPIEPPVLVPVEIREVLPEPSPLGDCEVDEGCGAEFDMELFIEGVKHWEGFYPNLYKCTGGKTTIGFGFTGDEIKDRDYICKKVAERELIEEIIPKHAAHVEDVVKVPLTVSQKMALISFSYNLGRSNLIRLVSGKGRLNDGNYESVATIMPKYRKSAGVVTRGLVLRRAWEVDLFLGNLHSNYGN